MAAWRRFAITPPSGETARPTARRAAGRTPPVGRSRRSSALIRACNASRGVHRRDHRHIEVQHAQLVAQQIAGRRDRRLHHPPALGDARLEAGLDLGLGSLGPSPAARERPAPSSGRRSPPRRSSSSAGTPAAAANRWRATAAPWDGSRRARPGWRRSSVISSPVRQQQGGDLGQRVGESNPGAPAARPPCGSRGPARSARPRRPPNPRPPDRKRHKFRALVLSPTFGATPRRAVSSLPAALSSRPERSEWLPCLHGTVDQPIALNSLSNLLGCASPSDRDLISPAPQSTRSCRLTARRHYIVWRSCRSIVMPLPMVRGVAKPGLLTPFARLQAVPLSLGL